MLATMTHFKTIHLMPVEDDAGGCMATMIHFKTTHLGPVEDDAGDAWPPCTLQNHSPGACWRWCRWMHGHHDTFKTTHLGPVEDDAGGWPPWHVQNHSPGSCWRWCRWMATMTCSKPLTWGLLKMMQVDGWNSLRSKAPSSIGLYGTTRVGSTPQLALMTTLGWNQEETLCVKCLQQSKGRCLLHQA